MAKAKTHGSFPLVLSAPSGGGKTAIRRALLRCDKRFRFSVTCTTRPRRPGEKEGRDYYFVKPDRFAAMRRNGGLLEWARVHGNMYGTPARPVERLLEKGLMPVMTVDIKGARAVRRSFPGAVTVFLLPPDLKTLVKRLKRRGESEDGIKVRLATARTELKAAPLFDYLVVNDKLEDAVEAIVKIADAEAARPRFRRELVERFGRELRGFTPHFGR